MLLRRQEHAGITAATGRNLPIAHGAPTCVGPRSKEPSMTITRRVTVHEGPGGRFESMAVFDDAAGAPRPGVLLFPNVLGAKEAAFAYAERVAALGLAVLVETGRAHVCTPVTNSHIVCRLLLEKKNTPDIY